MTPIGGVNVAALTPRGENGREVNFAAALDLIDYLCAVGVQGIAVLGSTGEFLNLSFDERNRLVYMAAKRSRIPLLAGVSHSSLDGALELGRESLGAGAAGLLLMPPYFFRYEQDDIREFYLRFAEQIGADAQVFLYNIPSFSNEIACETAIALLSTGRFAGIKDSSGSWEYFGRLKELSDRLRFTLLVGNDVIFTRARQAGAHGVVSGVACAIPELMLGLDRAIGKGAADAIQSLEAKLQEFIRWLDRFPVPVGIKVATAARGLKVGPCAVPLSPERKRTLAEFQQWLNGWLPAVIKEAVKA